MIDGQDTLATTPLRQVREAVSSAHPFTLDPGPWTARTPAFRHGFAYSPYCGAPPDPGGLLYRWNFDPVLLMGLAFALLAYVAGARLRPHRIVTAPWRRPCFYAGWAVAAAAVVSPLCALSVSLFSARLGQHLILETIAAPLVALGLPSGVFTGTSTRRLRSGAPGDAPLAAVVFAGTLWFWHAPGPYAASFDGAGFYWLMHLTSFGAALWLWRAVFEAPGDRPGACLAAMFGTSLQMGFLGALLTFAARPFYPVHALTTWAWGISPLQDQQLGGVLMWIPTGVIYLWAMAVIVTAVLRRSVSGQMAVARP